MPGELTLQPGERFAVTRLLAVADSPAAAYSIVASEFESGTVTGTVTGTGRSAPGRATVSVRFPESEQSIPAYTNDDGGFALHLPAGRYRLECHHPGRDPVVAEAESVIGESARQDFQLGAQSAMVFAISGEDGSSLPCKAQFEGVGGTATPNLGSDNRPTAAATSGIRPAASSASRSRPAPTG